MPCLQGISVVNGLLGERNFVADMWQMEQGIETAGWKCRAPFAVVTFVEITAGTRARAASFSYVAEQGGFV